MDEHDFRKSLPKEELERRPFIVPFKVFDFTTLERLNHYSAEFGKTFDELINVAIVKFLNDISHIHSLRD